MLDTKAKIVSQSVYLFMVIFTFFDMFELKNSLIFVFRNANSAFITLRFHNLNVHK